MRAAAVGPKVTTSACSEEVVLTNLPMPPHALFVDEQAQLQQQASLIEELMRKVEQHEVELSALRARLLDLM